MRTLLVVGLMWMAAPAFAEERVPSALVCSLKAKSSGTLERTGEFAPGTHDDRMQFTFAAIDLEAGTAQVIGNQGASNIYAMQGSDSINFIERTISGNINLTTVFLGEGGGPFGAVHSRHVVMLDAAVVSQYVGTCDAKF